MEETVSEIYNSYFWKKIEAEMDTFVPLHVKNILYYTGFANPVSFKRINRDGLIKITNFVRSPKYGRVVQNEKRENYFGFFYQDDTENFEFSIGDEELILGIVDKLVNKPALFKSTQPSSAPFRVRRNFEEESQDTEAETYIKNREISTLKKKINIWQTSKSQILSAEVKRQLSAITLNILFEYPNNREMDFYAEISCIEPSCTIKIIRFHRRSSRRGKKEWCISNYTRHLATHYPELRQESVEESTDNSTGEDES